ncbi:hypothetical protein ACFL0Y_02555 [Patescibacteria group bacterium]
MNKERINQALRQSWGKDTCYPPMAEKWTEGLPEYGQCAVTALVVQDLCDGLLVVCDHEHHYWIILSDGEQVDLTEKQFESGTVTCLDRIAEREVILFGEGSERAKTPQRHAILLKKTVDALKKI